MDSAEDPSERGLAFSSVCNSTQTTSLLRGEEPDQTEPTQILQVLPASSSSWQPSPETGAVVVSAQLSSDMVNQSESIRVFFTYVGLWRASTELTQNSQVQLWLQIDGEIFFFPQIIKL